MASSPEPEAGPTSISDVLKGVELTDDAWDRLNKAVAEQGSVSTVTDCSSGIDQLVAKITLLSGKQLVLKVPRTSDHVVVKAERYACRKFSTLNATTTLVPVPTILDSELKFKTEGSPLSFVLETCMPGLRMSDMFMSGELSAAAQKTALTDLGRVMRRMHSVKVTGFGPVEASVGSSEPHGAAPSFRTLMCVMAHDCELRAVKSRSGDVSAVDFTGTLRASCERVGKAMKVAGLATDEALAKLDVFLEACEAADVFAAVEVPSIVHKDLDMDNIIMDSKAHNITGIVDFGDVEHLPALFDLASMQARVLPFSGALMQHVLNGYCEADQEESKADAEPVEDVDQDCYVPTQADCERRWPSLSAPLFHFCVLMDCAMRALRRYARGGDPSDLIATFDTILALYGTE